MTRRVFGSILAAFAVAAPWLLTSRIASAQSGSPAVDRSVSIDGQATSLTTASFSTTVPGELLVAFAAADGPPTGGQTATITGAGLTWTLARRVNTRLGSSEIWTATAPTLLSGVTVTSTEGVGGYQQSLTVVTFTNAGGIGATAAADAANGAPSVSLTTTRAGAVVLAVGNDWDNAVPRTLPANQIMVHEYLPAVGDTMWVQNLAGAVASAGTTVQLNATAPTADRWNLAAVEIVPPQGPGFLVVAYNDTMTAGLSDSVTYNMLISPLGGFTGPLTCSTSAVPTGATGVMAPPGGPPHPGPISMTIITGAATPSGTYHPVTTCTAGTLSASTVVTLIVTSQPDFRVVLEPNSLTLTQAQTGVANFQIQSMNGYAQGANLSATGLPAGVTTTFTPSTLIPSAAGTLQLKVGSSTTPGIYTLSIRGVATNGTLTRQAPFTLTVLQPNSTGSWRQQALVDTPAQFYGSVVGDAGNTGKTRVYASGGNGLMYEYSFNGTSWSVAQVPFGVVADGEMHNGTVGPGRGDGINRLYIAANLSGRVYEASWVNNAWQVAVIGTFTSATDVVVGDGRNDGRTRTYVSWGGGATELTWTGSAWTQVILGNSEAGEVHCVDLAQGRNDGINRIYTSNDATGQVFEYSWNGTAWNKLLMGTNSDVRNVAFGEGRNDGKTRGYAASADGNVYEYTWSGTAWQNVSIGNAGVISIKVHANPVKAKGDNLTRIYAGGADGGVYEYSWNGSVWQTVRLGAATAYMYGLDQGDGLNKGGIQLYGTSYDGNAYLFEWIPANPPALVTVPSLLGLQQGSVAGVLNGVGLTVGTSTNQTSLTTLIGVVMGQTPAGGTPAPQGSAVNIVVSSGVGVPAVINLTQTTAVSALAAVNLTATISSAPSATVPSGSVATQSPAAGVRVSGGSAVAIVVSTGPPPPVTVPNVVNLTQAVATTAITNAGLLVGTVTTASSATVPSGSIISESPVAGTQVAAGSAVNLVRSTGATVAVPNVVNLTQAAATTAITNAGLLVGAVTTASSATVLSGSIISESPVAGTQVARGSAVNLVRSTGPATGAIAVDRVVPSSDGIGTRTTSAFSTLGPGELLLAFVSSDGPGSGAQTLTVSGAGLSWTLVRRANTQAGTAEIWKATAAAQLSNVTVTSTLSSGGFRQSLTVVAFTGASGTGASAIANGASGAPSVTLVTTQPGSLVYGVANDWDRAVARTLGATQTMVHQWVETTAGDTFWVQARTGAVTAVGTSVQLNDTAPANDRWNFASVEIVR